ncbi:glycosyltransferase [Azovibrio restrictus]|uniref:glycosyltransferase n=1 Tax=Azovibrio restrictus TaxID=146938 RepID=UPI00040C5C81|nr:glycosyltransferase [Azovibrio restrictus]
MKKVLILASYSCVTPLHGGQIRLSEIIKSYQAAGHAVQSLNLYSMMSVGRGSHDFNYPLDTPWRLWQGRSVPLIEDLTSGRYAAGDEEAYARLTRAVEGVPDVIQVEQPWLFPLVARWRREGVFPGATIVYSSHNVEAPLKLAILRQYGIPEAEQIAAEIDALERQACELADVVLAVSRSDCQVLGAWCRQPVVLAANGIAAWPRVERDMAAWRGRLPQQPFPLFVGSAHPPNISGFFEVFGESLGFLPPDTRLCVLGSVGAHLPENPRMQRWLPLNLSRLQVLGVVDEAGLAAVKNLAHVIVLPITEGGGSNIKTAEALYSGKHVLGTPVSFRGFDAYLGMPGVHVAEPGRPFREKLRELLQAPPLAPAAPDLELRQSLLWRHTLAPMVSAVDQHLQSRSNHVQ